MKITIDIPRCTADCSFSWEKLQDMLRSCFREPDPFANPPKQTVLLTKINRTDHGVCYRDAGEYRVTVVVDQVGGSKEFEGKITVETEG